MSYVDAAREIAEPARSARGTVVMTETGTVDRGGGESVCSAMVADATQRDQERA